MKKKTMAWVLMMVLVAGTLMFAGCKKKEEPKEDASTQTEETDTKTDEATETDSAENKDDSSTDSDVINFNIAAAASLEDVFENELIPLFLEQNDLVNIKGTYDSSGKLQTQIEEGLDADIFMSAATKQMTALTDEDLIDGSTVVNLLENQIVLIAPTDSKTTVTSFEKIGDAATIAIGDPESVPAGQYAQEALTTLGVWDSIQSKVSLGTNVTEVLNQVAEGSAEVGIVYATDAAQMPDKVKVIATAPEGSLKTPVIYPVGILTNSKQKEIGTAFVEFLQTPEAITIFEKAGFKSNL
ncbi:MAG: molybdate ABC transporter substrate-binding protein [Lachnospiraceae bacterium]|jgi:molybdate transport system substrate-binding protein|nr:molybdate ABC transporter substrate-binding protein [Lachnospiraceae bacterium]